MNALKFINHRVKTRHSLCPKFGGRSSSKVELGAERRFLDKLNEGMTLGAYKIVRLLGQGGMGAVYEVEHVELGVRYALKTFYYDEKADLSISNGRSGNHKFKRKSNNL